MTDDRRRLLQYLFSEPSDNPARIASHRGHHHIPIRWMIGLGLLTLLTFALALLSPQFSPDKPLAQQPILQMVFLYTAMGGAFLYLSELVRHTRSGRKLMTGLLLTGALLRLFMAGSTPILEVDFNRYLWDGALTAHGFNPYTYSPESVRTQSDVPAELRALAALPEATVDQINHPGVRTIYPPLTQAAFALAYWLGPWKLGAWRALLLLADVATLMTVFLLLRELGLSPLWSTIYWLNPLVIKEILNSTHMDVLLFPLLLFAIFLMLRRRTALAPAILGLAVGVKFWPALLFPLFLRRLWPDWGRMAVALTVFAGTCTAVMLPMMLSTWDSSAGLSQYGTRWELNDSLFQLIVWTSIPLLKLFGYHPGHSQLAARLTVVALLLLWVVYQTLLRIENERQWIDRLLLVTAALFLLSPTQYPWYATWMAPLLAISPRKALLFLPLLLPLYYLWYYFDARGEAAIFHYGIVWLEFVPVWILIIREWRTNRRLGWSKSDFLEMPTS